MTANNLLWHKLLSKGFVVFCFVLFCFELSSTLLSSMFTPAGEADITKCNSKCIAEEYSTVRYSIIYLFIHLLIGI